MRVKYPRAFRFLCGARRRMPNLGHTVSDRPAEVDGTHKLGPASSLGHGAARHWLCAFVAGPLLEHGSPHVAVGAFGHLSGASGSPFMDRHPGARTAMAF